MKQNVFSSVKCFNETNTMAKRELNGIFKNPFVVINLLNKAYKGDFEKINNCEGITRESIVLIGKTLKSLHKYSTPFAYDYLFDAGVCAKDSKNRLCTIATSKVMPKWGVDLVSVDENGYKYFKPVMCSVTSIYNVFAKAAKLAVKSDENELNSAKKAAKKANEKAIKEARAKYNGVIRDYNSGRISEFEFAAKIKEAKSELDLALAA